MKILSVLQSIGTGLLAEAGPIGLLAATAINAFFDKDDAIDPNKVTGQDVLEKIKKLDSSKQSELLGKEIEYKMHESDNWVRIQEIITEDNLKGKSTRPIIALIMACVTSTFVLGMGLMIGIVSYSNKTYPNWELVTALLGIPSYLLRSYFGLASRETRDAVGLASGQLINRPIGQQLVDRFLGKA